MAAEEQEATTREPAVDGDLHAEDFHVAGGGRHVRPVDLERPHAHHVEETGQTTTAEAQERPTTTTTTTTATATATATTAATTILDFHPPAAASEEAAPAPPRPQEQIQQQEQTRRWKLQERQRNGRLIQLKNPLNSFHSQFEQCRSHRLLCCISLFPFCASRRCWRCRLIRCIFHAHHIRRVTQPPI